MTTLDRAPARPNIYIFIQKMNLLEIAMLFLNKFYFKVIGFFQIIDDDDIDNIIVEIFHRRNNFLNKYLDRERLEFETIELNREVYFTT